MKKKGKFVKQAVQAAPAGKSGIKHTLLQTYFTSLLCLVLCVTMFFGTSYAWFTSEVTNTNNQIHVGILKVGLYKEDGTDLSAEGNLFDGNIRWEPGCTFLETIRIVNEGDLAFKYVLSFTEGEVDSGELEAVADSFEVWVFDHLNKTYQQPDSYDAITRNPDWVKVGTLAEVLNGKPVLENRNMVSVRAENQDPAVINEGTEDGLATPDTYTIALHMKDDAASGVMGKKISLNVKLIAYQMASSKEADGLEAAYDNVTGVMDVDKLRNSLGNGENVLLLSDIAVEETEDRLHMAGGILDGNSETITYTGGRVNDGSVGVLTTTGGIVRNLTIAGGEDGRALYVTNLSSDLLVSNCTLSGAYAFNVNSAEATGKTMTFVKTVFNAWTSYANVMEHAYFTNCVLNGTLKPYGDTTLTNCEFSGETLNVSSLAEGETITLVNCTYAETTGANVVVKCVDGQIVVEGASFRVSEDGYLVAFSG